MDRRLRVSIVTSGHDVADARLHREVAALVRAGAAVEVMGLGDAAGGPPGVTVRTWPRGSLLVRAWHALRLPWLATGDALVTLDPDSAVGAMLRARLSGSRRPVIVVDVHEDYGKLLRDRAWSRGPAGRVGRTVVRAFDRAAAGADLTVVADAHLSTDAHHRLVVRNLPDRSMLPDPGPADSRPRLLYVGDLRASRGLGAMLSALRVASEWTLDLVGPLDGAPLEGFRATLADDPGLAARVRWHGRLEPRRAWALAAGAWAGLSLLDDTPAFREAMPSKLYEYLACGIPVLTTDLPRPAALVRQTGAGAVVSDVAELVAQLDAWLSNPADYLAVRDRAVDAGRGLDGEPELSAFAAGVIELAARRRGASTG